jgi:acyl carrier protein
MDTVTNDVKDKLRHFIASQYLPGESPEHLRDDTPLLTSGILDSLATISVIAFLESEFHVTLDFNDTSIEMFDSIHDIAATIRRKQTCGVAIRTKIPPRS